MSAVQTQPAVSDREHDAILDAVARPGLDFMPDSDGNRIIVSDPLAGRHLRMSASAARLLQALDGTRTPADIAAHLGITDPAMVDQALARFRDLQLTTTAAEAAQAEPPKAPRRWRYRPPGVLELALLNPVRLLAACAPLGRAAASRAGQLLVGAVTVGGLGYYALTGSAATDELARPTSLPVVLGMLLLMITTTFVHEIGHGLSLVRGGGRVHRLGVMLMYGSPAMFCDVSEAWRLPRGKRLLVALAGIRVHLAAAGLAGAIAPNLPPGGWRQLLAGLLVSNLLMAVINLCPFVKFDGYVALIGWLDRPHLRATAMADAQRTAAVLVFGGRLDQRPRLRRVLFGTACAITAPVLVTTAFLSYQTFVLVVLGPIGATLVLAALGWVGYLLLRKLAQWHRLAKESGAGPVRRLAGGLVLAAVLAGALTGIRLPHSVSSVYATTPQGLAMVLPADTDAAVLAGRQVDLQASGVVLHPKTAEATVCGASTTRSLPVEAGSPVAVPVTARASRTVVPLCVRTPPSRTDGLTTVRLDDITLASWLFHTFAAPAWAQLF
ncbi:daptide biosynthesis intramembrane metalloprotease [Streptomyces sp. NPDC092296]|uniref:daptide biosynthesis intramembrane metalloprotease n=1 Tax=Streptomyces sp. NPDC092296 TaxID=3366012 RepID=UPI0038162977